MIIQKTSKQRRIRRKNRVRAAVRGIASRPRFSVFRSNQRLSVQIINDETGVTLFSVSTDGTNKSSAKKLGMEVAQKAKKNGISSVVFDRGGNKYHGVIKELADAAREGGLLF